MKVKTLYTCEICHTDYTDKQQATQCEKSHFTDLTIVDKRYVAVKVPVRYGTEGFPITITVKNKNGDTVIYKR